LRGCLSLFFVAFSLFCGAESRRSYENAWNESLPNFGNFFLNFDLVIAPFQNCDGVVNRSGCMELVRVKTATFNLSML
jgi:hypothetical protein